MKKIRQGEIYWISFDGSVGHEYRGQRPGVVIQSSKKIGQTSVITIMPITSKTERPHRDDILIPADGNNRLFVDSAVKVHYIMSFDKGRFIKKIGNTERRVVDEIQQYLCAHFGIKDS